MKTKFLILAIILGLLVNALFIVVPPSKQIANFKGSNQPNSGDFIYASEYLKSGYHIPSNLCAGPSFTINMSIRKTGYPFKSTVEADFEDCTSASASHTALSLFSSSMLTLPFYINWFIWSAVCCGVLLIIHKLLTRKK